MKSILNCVTIVFSILLVHTSCTRRDDLPVLKGPYLGQKSPGKTPEIFAPGIISTNALEICISFAPGGKELYFVRKNKVLIKKYYL